MVKVDVRAVAVKAPAPKREFPWRRLFAWTATVLCILMTLGIFLSWALAVVWMDRFVGHQMLGAGCVAIIPTIVVGIGALILFDA